ncbi:hypothetical protein LUZ60_004343 [Juncus effusus]|nr:hypothetical protein LUZ60_004343 [Juncus effusus]
MKAAESQTLLQNPTSLANGDSKAKSPKKQKNRKNKEEEKKSEVEKEGSFLLGNPTFKKLPGDGGGRWRCVETGQEMPEKEKEAYSRSRACRIGLINTFVAKKRAPLNVFEQNPANKNQLICKITGDTVNKSEEHIWKHLNGIRFNNKLAQMELDALKTPEEIVQEAEEKKLREEKKRKKNPVNKKLREQEAKKKEMEAAMLCKQEKTEEKEEKKAKKEKKKNKKKEAEAEMEVEEEEVEAKEEKKKPNKKEKKEKKKKVNKKGIEASGGDEEEPEFWMPPVGERWDFDDGKDENGDGEEDPESGELTTRAKRLSIDAVGPSSFASRKKKMKKSS